MSTAGHTYTHTRTHRPTHLRPQQAHQERAPSAPPQACGQRPPLPRTGPADSAGATEGPRSRDLGEKQKVALVPHLDVRKGAAKGVTEHRGTIAQTHPHEGKWRPCLPLEPLPEGFVWFSWLGEWKARTGLLLQGSENWATPECFPDDQTSLPGSRLSGQTCLPLIPRGHKGASPPPTQIQASVFQAPGRGLGHSPKGLPARPPSRLQRQPSRPGSGQPGPSLLTMVPML